MKKIVPVTFLLLSIQGFMFAQQGTVRGVVTDQSTGETLIGANILAEDGSGTVTDVDGSFVLTLTPGKQTLRISYVGYEPRNITVTVGQKDVYITISLKTLTINEVQVVADVARNRQTPVAFTNVLPAKIKEELGGRDIPLILNSTPGVYATQQGGGDGDARITIRGFNQRNIAVMIDGIPVNDMENGWVYWSNWFGLDQVTRTIQVQRGLGASKLALPSVGGTLNILTMGIRNKRELSVKQEITSEGKIRSSVGYTSGKLPGGWGITLAGSYKRGQGWVDHTFSEGWFYYAKIDKRTGAHILTFSAMGAPQHHEQRSYKRAIATYNLDYARKLGIDVDVTDSLGNFLYRPKIYDKGIGYNQHWGQLKRDRFNPDAPLEGLSERVNIYHKPQFSLRDFWRVSNKLTLSNIAYLSLGTGGGDRPAHSIRETMLIQDPDSSRYGEIDWQSIYDANAKPTQTPFGPVYPIDNRYSDSLYVSYNYMTRQHNDHIWTGLLSTFNLTPSDNLKIAGGVDLRQYTGIHYTTITDLLGGDYAVDKSDLRNNYDTDSSLAMKYPGDTTRYYYKGLVNWGGLFFQTEYTGNGYSFFINLTSAINGYKKIDYFANRNSGWFWKPGFTIKAGGNYNLSPRSNIYLNTGFLSKVRAYRYFYKGYTTEFADETGNEKIKALETGYHYGSPRFSLNLNAYLTKWQNKPTNRVYSNYVLQPGENGFNPDDPDKNKIRVYADIPGMDALHKGIELDMIWKARHNLNIQGLLSLGDWRWDKRVENLQYYNYDTNEPVNKVINFDATGIHVGDAAQTQVGTSIRYEPFRGFYINSRYTYFARYYSDFTPESTTDEAGNPVDSWKVPNYALFDLHLGYHLRAGKTGINFRFSLFNALNTKYISDAVNNDPYNSLPFNDFDAKSATVFFGMGRRFNSSVEITF
ncbi:MAG: TonB-dependent receptor plug domain-containing protein [Chlorobi bacterium]|nr:TonB-dependent receptor plug domain-containing protein [Chlorobiota bacterium]